MLWRSWLKHTVCVPTTREALEAAIADDPDDVAAYLSYGDLLQQTGDPRGELIALSHARETAPGDKLDRAIAKLMKLPALHFAASTELVVTWQWGFIRSARIDLQLGELARLRASPSARFLRELVIGPMPGLDYRKAVAAAAKIATLRKLVIGDFFSPDEGHVRQARIGSLAKLGALPLRELVVQGRDVELAGLALPELARLELRGAAIPIEQLAAAFPQLEELVLWGDPDPDLAVLLGGALPRLTKLGLRFLADGDAFCAALAESPLKKRLVALDLRGGVFSAAGLARIRKTIAVRVDGPHETPQHPDRLAPATTRLEELHEAAYRHGDDALAARIECHRKSVALAQRARLATSEAQARYALAVAVHTNGQLAEARQHLERALELQRDRRAQKEVKALLATVLFELGDERRAAELAAQPEDATAREKASSLITRASAESGRGQHRAARELYEQALALARKARDDMSTTHSIHMLAVCDQMLGHVARSRRGYETARQRMVGPAYERERPKLLGNLGGLLFQLGDWDEAETCYREALEASRAIGDRRNEAHVISNLGQLYIWRGDYAQALPTCEQALARFRDIGYRDGIRKALSMLADAYLQAGDNARAQAAAEEVLVQARELGDAQEEALGLKILGDIALNRWHLDAGERLCKEAHAIYRRVNQLMGVAGCDLAIGGARIAAGDFAAADRRIATAQATYTKLGFDHGWPASQRGLLELCRGDRAAAAHHYRAALVLAETAKDAGQIRRNRATLAACLDGEAATAMLADASALFAAVQDPVGLEQLAIARAFVAGSRRPAAVPASFEARLLYERLWREPE